MSLHNSTGLSDQFLCLDEAIVCPLDPATGACGVLDANGEFMEFSREFPRPRKAAFAPDPDRIRARLERLEGAHLYAGWLRPHFGHMLVEATSRLWALDELAGAVQSVLFIPSAPKSIWRARRQYLPLLTLFTGGLDPRPVTAPMVVERLYLPDPGFGHEARMRGSPRYRAYMRARVAADIAPIGGEKLYISRSALKDTKGGVFGEDRIEAMFAAQGYEIYHPQNHPARDQLARYRAARLVAGLDGSAFHMAALALPPEAKVAVIARRKASIQTYLTEQLRLFTSADVINIDAISEMWVNQGATRIDYSSVGEIDFAALHAGLVAQGFLDPAPALPNLTEAEIAQIIENSDRSAMERFRKAAAG